MIGEASALRAALSELILFQGVSDDPLGGALRRWLERAAQLEDGGRGSAGVVGGTGDAAGPDSIAALRQVYTYLFGALAHESTESIAAESGESSAPAPPTAESARDPQAGSTHSGAAAAGAWAAHWIGRILVAENPFSISAARGGAAGVPLALRHAAAHDLECLRRLSAAGSGRIRRLTEAGTTKRDPGAPDPDSDSDSGLGLDLDLGLGTPLPEWDTLPIRPIPPGTTHPDAFRRMTDRLADALDEPGGWRGLVDELAEFYRQVGCGAVARYGAFRWEQGRMLGISAPDPGRIADLIGYERERAQVVENTSQFVRGLPANNVLLYGERGTGKSATVKALLHEFGREGLRLLELPKSGLGETTHIFRTLAGLPQRFILYIDDLSFEGDEVDYKELKAVLEGGLERQPENVRIYATSNRRHLVQERMRERPRAPYGVSAQPGEDEEVRGWDVVQERLSLADRFGLTVIFQAPDQDAYLRIVEGLAERRGVTLPREDLKAAALRWTLQQNGRSPRTAHQFIDHLAGRIESDGQGGALPC